MAFMNHHGTKITYIVHHLESLFFGDAFVLAQFVIFGGIFVNQIVIVRIDNVYAIELQLEGGSFFKDCLFITQKCNINNITAKQYFGCTKNTFIISFG